MKFNYTVRKSKGSRTAFRVLGTVFFVVAALQFITLIKGYAKHPMLAGTFAMLLGAYGLYLIYGSLRKAAFDIVYHFTEEGLNVEHHYGETSYGYTEDANPRVEFVTMVIADEAGVYYILNVKTSKEVFVIPFPMKGELCERIYEFVNARLPKKEEND
ncbi:MAG: hypothetical protein IKO61_04320 [Lachnospiraceae bacterium]|nr:hypothetical protein [Lachnospiraceae bacterium]